MEAVLRPAFTPAEIATVRLLFEEYQRSLGISLCFQNFDAELASLPGVYAPPSGALLLAYADGEPAGCVAVRPLGEGIAEIKRLYVRPAFRETGLGRRLAQAALSAARWAGHRGVRLDTLPSMKEAQALYASLGFRDIPPYNDHPVEGTRFMEAILRPPG